MDSTNLPDDRCMIRGCQRTYTVFVTFNEWGMRAVSLCDLHKPTAEQALRRGVVISFWMVHGYYPAEIAAQLSSMTGHTVRESTVLADLKWLGLTEADRAAEARLSFDVALGNAGPNVVALRRRAR